MRLINADALKKAMLYNGGCGICFMYLDDADTIDAIPVEWLKSLAQNQRDCDSPAIADFIERMIDAWHCQNGDYSQYIYAMKEEL